MSHSDEPFEEELNEPSATIHPTDDLPNIGERASSSSGKLTRRLQSGTRSSIATIVRLAKRIPDRRLSKREDT